MTVNETVDGRPRAAAEAAAARICRRRAAADDPDLGQLSDDLFGTAMYAATRHNVADQVIRSDTRDAWEIIEFIDHHLDLLRLRLIQAAVAAGDTYTTLAPMAQVTTRQGVEALVRRLEAAAAGHPKDALYARLASAAERRDAERALSVAHTARHLTTMLTGADFVPDDLQPDLAEMRDAARRGATRVLVARARLLVDELLDEHGEQLADQPGLLDELREYRTALHLAEVR